MGDFLVKLWDGQTHHCLSLKMGHDPGDIHFFALKIRGFTFTPWGYGLGLEWNFNEYQPLDYGCQMVRQSPLEIPQFGNLEPWGNQTW